MDTLNRYYEGLKMAIKGIRTNMKPSNRKILDEYGNLNIITTYVVRTPLRSAVKTILTVAHDTLQKTKLHDELFHLYCVFELSNNKKFIVEKNEDINITEFKEWKNIDEYIVIQTPPNLSLNIILANTLNYVGADRFYKYDAFDTNCQHFVYNILLANGYKMDNDIKKYILQDVKDLLPKWAKNITTMLTSFFNRIKILIHGKGMGYNYDVLYEYIK